MCHAQFRPTANLPTVNTCAAAAAQLHADLDETHEKDMALTKELGTAKANLKHATELLVKEEKVKQSVQQELASKMSALEAGESISQVREALALSTEANARLAADLGESKILVDSLTEKVENLNEELSSSQEQVERRDREFKSLTEVDSVMYEESQQGLRATKRERDSALEQGVADHNQVERDIKEIEGLNAEIVRLMDLLHKAQQQANDATLKQNTALQSLKSVQRRMEAAQLAAEEAWASQRSKLEKEIVHDHDVIEQEQDIIESELKQISDLRAEVEKLEHHVEQVNRELEATRQKLAQEVEQNEELAAVSTDTLFALAFAVSYTQRKKRVIVD